jgi:hypothetical protein
MEWGAVMQKANVGHGGQKMDERVRKRELTCVRRSRVLYRDQVVRCAVPMTMGKKHDEEAKKRKWKDGFFCSQGGVRNPVRTQISRA